VTKLSYTVKGALRVKAGRGEEEEVVMMVWLSVTKVFRVTSSSYSLAVYIAG
jgi:hypothetical protein